MPEDTTVVDLAQEAGITKEGEKEVTEKIQELSKTQEIVKHWASKKIYWFLKIKLT